MKIPSSPMNDVMNLNLVLRVLGAALLVAIGAIHLDLYLTGYRTIPTIGWLFLLQLIGAFGIGAILLVAGNRLVALMGAGLSISTLGGYLLSLRISLFGFREVRTTAGIVAGVIEVVAFAVLAALALTPTKKSSTSLSSYLSRATSAIPGARWSAGALTVVAAVLLGLSLAATGPTSANTGTSGTLLKATNVGGVPVVTNSKGFTLYWFVPDTATKSTCYGTCAVYWPPVTGTGTAGSGVTGVLGTIQRSGGGTEVTYDHHPLYAYVGDNAPGQANGNNINLNGGVWHEMKVAG